MSYPIKSSEVHPGAQISEHIRIFAHVGSDDFGSVWEGVHAFEGRVAVKVFDGDMPDDVGCRVIEEGAMADDNMFIVCDADEADGLVRESAQGESHQNARPQDEPSASASCAPDAASASCAPDAASASKRPSIYGHLHDALTCTPPMRRNWVPVIAAAAAAAATVGMIIRGVF